MPQKAKDLWKLDRSGSPEAVEAGATPPTPGDGNQQTFLACRVFTFTADQPLQGQANQAAVEFGAFRVTPKPE